jgi:hypothetical protein
MDRLLTRAFMIHFASYIAESKAEVLEDLGSTTSEDIAYEIAIVMHVISGCAEEVDGEYLVEDYQAQIRTYLHRLFALIENALELPKPRATRLWQHIFLSDCRVLLNDSSSAILELDQAAQLLDEITHMHRDHYRQLSTILFLVRKFKERLALRSKFKAARIFELNAIVTAIIMLCSVGEISSVHVAPFKHLAVTLLEAEHRHQLPKPETLEQLELALARAQLN